MLNGDTPMIVETRWYTRFGVQVARSPERQVAAAVLTVTRCRTRF